MHTLAESASVKRRLDSAVKERLNPAVKERLDPVVKEMFDPAIKGFFFFFVKTTLAGSVGTVVLSAGSLVLREVVH